MASVTSGSLTEKPLAHLFVYALEKKLTGTLELTKANGSESAAIVLAGGHVAKIKTSTAVAYLGAVLYELGFLQSAELNQSLLELSKQRRPQGQILLDLKLVTREKLDSGLREQALRKLAHCFLFGRDATFAFHSDVDLLPAYGGNDPVLTDPSPAIWRGIREHASERHVKEAIDRIGAAPCRLVRGARIERFQFQSDVLTATQSLRVRAIGVEELHTGQCLTPKVTELLLYCLLITKELEVVDAAAPPKRASLPQLDAMRASVTKMRAVTPSSPDYGETHPSPSPDNGPISFRLSAASVVPSRMPSSPVPSRMPSSPVPSRMPSSPSPSRPSSPSNPAISADHLRREQAIHDRATSIVKEDMFKRLSLQKNASHDAIEAAYRMLVRLWDPGELPPLLYGARDSCGIVRTMLVEAHATLIDPRKRVEYERKLSMGMQLPDPASDLAASGEKNDYDGAKACLLKNDLDRAERMAKRAHKAAPEKAAPLALLAWVAAQQPANQGAEAIKARIAMLDKAITLDETCEEAFWYRSQLHKRVENHPAAMRDLQWLTTINPHDVEAMRELRIYEMRVRSNSMSMQAVRSFSPSAVKATTPSGLFDRLRKK